MKRLLAVLLLFGLASCSAGHHDDLEKFVRDSGQGLRGKVEPLPEVKPYEPFQYEAFDLPDPFKPRKLKSASGSGIGAPDVTRRKEPLEAYELEKLKMVGTLQQGKVTYALIKAPDASLYRVKPGNYMGTNYGIVTDISDTDVKLTEIVEDSEGEWTERTNTLTLVEESSSGQKK